LRLVSHQCARPLIVALICQRRERSDVDRLRAGRLREQPQQRELGADGLAGAGGRADEHVVVRRVESRKCLRGGIGLYILYMYMYIYKYKYVYLRR